MLKIKIYKNHCVTIAWLVNADIPEAKQGGFNSTMFEFYLRRMIAGFSFGLSADQFETVYRVLRWNYAHWSNLEDIEANRQAINKVSIDLQTNLMNLIDMDTNKSM